MDAYYYARDHAAGPGAWCVRGPNDFEMTIPNLTKDQAYVIGKVLSGEYQFAGDWTVQLAHPGPDDEI